MNCIFCKIIKKEIPCNLLYEDESCFVFLDIKPITKGHTLVVPKKHSENLLDIEEKDVLHCMNLIKKLGPKIMKAMKADGFNVGQNNFSAAGQTVMHTHFHIIPRYKNDGLKNWQNKDTSADALLQAEKEIKKALRVP
ncbi:HIT family protein [Candidatus Woesearchaeota archaeon]|nr:MAG: HIT family protein [Candidatus Woesearchaeota archaeon]